MSNPLASSIMTRTTLDVDATVLNQLRIRAAAEHKTMGQVASEMLAPALTEGEGGGTLPRPLHWSRKEMGAPRIDLEDKEALWLFLDREQPEDDAG
jgi:plasmid stability protein